MRSSEIRSCVEYIEKSPSNDSKDTIDMIFFDVSIYNKDIKESLIYFRRGRAT